MSIRIFEDMSDRQEEIRDFWAKALNLPASQITKFNILSGKKLGKLPYGMCRIRLIKGESTLKLIFSAIEQIKRDLN